MMERILDISDHPTRLTVRYSQLVIQPDGAEEVTTPLSEVAVLVLSQSQVSITQAVISGLAENGGSVVFTDGKHLPSAMMLPLQVHSTQTERFAAQINASAPMRKRLWQQLVRAKIRAQGNLLKELHGTDSGLIAMAERVRSGDAGNIESQASRKYWPLLFTDPKFRRGREGPDQNAHLNYGYAILRATVCRALCAAGLHPSFGLQHHNRYDPFCLTNDVMEPFRPVIDRAVYQWIQDHDPTEPLNKEAKAALLAPFFSRFVIDGESRSLFDAAARLASDLAGAFLRKDSKIQLRIPEV
jgi:CRISPR-associated protein Cas1